MEQLPADILVHIFRAPELGLTDLYRLREPLLGQGLPAVEESLEHAAAKHLHTQLLQECVEIHPESVLSLSSWRTALLEDAAEGRPTTRQIHMWDLFGSTSPLQDAALVDLCSLFARITRHAFHVHRNSTSVADDPSSVLHFCQAVCLAALRALSRRSWSREVRKTIAIEQVDTELYSEFIQLRADIRLCDPMAAHDALWHTMAAGKPSLCPCCDRTWMSWYSMAWQFLLSRYRRHFTPDDVGHVAYRIILFSAFCFPVSTAATSEQQVALKRSQASPPDWIQQTLFWNTHLNPDAMLFNLKESETHQRTKEWFGVSEFVLSPGLARTWASWLGYHWGEGGHMWRDRDRGQAERRLRNELRGGGGDIGHVDSIASPQKPLQGFKRQLGPIEMVLLSHARWRARILLSSLDPNFYMHPDRLAQCRDLDVHFVRRSLQLQTWAIGGLSDGSSSGGSSSGSGSGSALGGETASQLVGSVHPSSPFLAHRHSSCRVWLDWLLLSPAYRLGVLSRDPKPEPPVDRAQAWQVILAPLRVAIARDPPSELDDGDAWEAYALDLLGTLDEGAEGTSRACSERPGFIPTVPVRVNLEQRPVVAVAMDRWRPYASIMLAMAVLIYAICRKAEVKVTLPPLASDW